jgi:hypothetical protein
MQRFEIARHHTRDRHDHCHRISVLAPFDFRQFAVALLPPKANLTPLRDAQEIVLPERFCRTRMRLNNVRRPPDSHVVHEIEAQRREFGGEGRSAIQTGTRHLQTMGDDAIAGRFRIKFERHHMDLMNVSRQAARKLPGPMFEPAAPRVEPLKNESYFHT